MNELVCPHVNRTTPYFVEANTENETVNEQLFNLFKEVNKNHIDLNDRGMVVEGIEKVPDGVITVEKASKEKLSLKLQISDSPFYQYHRNNGLTKLGFAFRKDSDYVKNSGYLKRPIESSL